MYWVHGLASGRPPPGGWGQDWGLQMEGAGVPQSPRGSECTTADKEGKPHPQGGRNRDCLEAGLFGDCVTAAVIPRGGGSRAGSSPGNERGWKNSLGM